MACLPLLLVSVLFTSTASAWFYFPNPKSVSLETAPDIPFTLNVYLLKNDGTLTQYDAVTTGGTASIPIDLNFSFFRWGSEYFCETDNTLYYVFEVIYDSDIFFTYGSRLPLQSIISANMTYAGVDEDNQPYTTTGGAYVRFPFYTVSYAIGADANIVLGEGHTALHEAQTASYTEIISNTAVQGAGATGSTQSGTLNDSVSESLTTLASARYKQVVTDGETSTSRLRIIYYVRVQADENLITQRLNSLGDTEHTKLILKTTLTMNSEFRTVPSYTGGN